MGANDAGDRVAVDDSESLDPATAAWLNRSSQEEAPRRKEKWEVACNST